MTEISPVTAAQREITRRTLACAEELALAGSGAIREHGLSDRPTEDVDVFMSSLATASFESTVTSIEVALRESGHTVLRARSADTFARLHVTTPERQAIEVDLGVDWRREEPVVMEVGRVLSLPDAVGSKMIALYSRGEARDYLDADAIRRSGVYPDRALIELMRERDPGFCLDIFVWRLEQVARLTIDDVERYGITRDQLVKVRAQTAAWAASLRNAPPG